MDNLTEDLLVVEILSRLPVKSLMHVGRVCKPWRSMRKVILSNPNFVKLHKLRNPDNNNYGNDSIIVHYIPKNEYQCHKLCVINMNFLERPPINLKFPLPTSTKPDDFSVVGSCSGLLCIAYMRKKKRPQNRLCLWNPATGQLKDIHNHTINIKFDNCHVSLGFGFDHASGDYKVVRIVRDLRKGFPSDASRVEVYSLNKDVWKEIDVEFKFRVLAESSCVAVRGVFYWLTEDDIALHNFGLVSFNVQSEKFRIIVLPNGIMSQWLPNIFNYKESLAITKIRYPDKDIWILDGNSTWIYKHTIINGASEIRDILGGLSTGKYVGETDGGKLLLCDLLNDKFKFMQQLPECSVLRTYNHSQRHQLQERALRIYNYRASLVIL